MSREAKKLKRLGKVWGRVEGSLVIEAELLPELGEKIYDSQLREVGRVVSVLGPVNHFFIEVMGGNLDYEQGTPLYVLRLDYKQGNPASSRST
jgi:rRNA processing protein Gar1